MPEPRRLVFDDFDAAVAEAGRLLEAGYEQAGAWTLGQNCRHLADFTRMSIDGFPGFKLPWPVSAAARAVLLSDKKLAKPMPRGLPTPKYLDPAGEDDAAAVADFVEQTRRFARSDGPFAKSPLFGRLSPAKWRKVHLNHAGHHLGMLVPR